VPRPRKGAARPDTVLVTFRLARGLVAALDELATQKRTQGRVSTRSDVARELMRQALTVQAHDTQVADVPARVLVVVHALARGPGRTATLASVRARLGDLPRSVVDQALWSLEREGRIDLGRAVDLAALTAQDRQSAIRDELRGLLVHVSLSKAPISV
jgi:hypothetical protein